MAPRSKGQYGIVVDDDQGALIIPKVPALIESLRNMDPEAVMDAIAPMAEQIIQEWTRAKSGLVNPEISQTTVTRYNRVAAMMEKKYSQDRGVEINTLSPVQIVQELFLHSQRLEDASWRAYRSAFIFQFNARIKSFQAKSAPATDYESYTRALATLIVTIRRPGAAITPLVPEVPKRAKSLTTDRFEDLFEALARPGGPKQAQDFAIATMATGLRPGEWANAEMRAATAADMTREESHAPWSVLTVQTSKRKGDLAIEFRTLLIREGFTRSLIVQHMATFKAAMARSKTKTGRPLVAPGEELLIEKCSFIIKETCKQIWPNTSRRWATLYTLRSQARANFVAEFGNELGSEMMGHSNDKGQRYYASKALGAARTRAASSLGQVLPGKDCVERALSHRPATARPDTRPDAPRLAETPDGDEA